MTYTDKGLSLFVLMTDMSEDLISESDIRGGAVHPEKVRHTGRFSAFMNHPATVAVLCAVVSLGVLMAIVLAGREAPLTPPAGTVYESEPVTEGETVTPEDLAASDVYVSYSPGDTTLYCEIIPKRYVFRSANVGDDIVAAMRIGFEGREAQVASLPVAQDAYLLTFHVSDTRRSPVIVIYDADMNLIHNTPLDTAESVVTDKLEAGTYYVSLQSSWQNDKTYGDDEFVFALSLSETIGQLRIEMFWKAATTGTE